MPVTKAVLVSNLGHHFYNCDLPLEEKLPREHFRRNHYLYDFDKGSTLNLLSDVVNQFFGFFPA